MDVLFEVVDPEGDDAVALLAAMEREMDELYGVGALTGSLVHAPELRPPHGVYLVGRDGAGVVVAGGAVRVLEPGLAEIKRMYVVPDARRGGVGRALLRALEDEARALGCDVARLDTGPDQPHAQRLYEDAGYRSIPDYNGNWRASFWGEKRLA